MRTFLIAVTRNPISLLGAAITTASAVLILNLFAVEFAGSQVVMLQQPRQPGRGATLVAEYEGAAKAPGL